MNRIGILAFVFPSLLLGAYYYKTPNFKVSEQRNVYGGNEYEQDWNRI